MKYIKQNVMLNLKVTVDCRKCGKAMTPCSEMMMLTEENNADLTPLFFECNCGEIHSYRLQLELYRDQASEERAADKKLQRQLWESCVSATCGCTTTNGKLPCERRDFSCLVYGERPCHAEFVQDMYQEMLDHRND